MHKILSVFTIFVGFSLNATPLPPVSIGGGLNEVREARVKLINQTNPLIARALQNSGLPEDRVLSAAATFASACGLELSPYYNSQTPIASIPAELESLWLQLIVMVESENESLLCNEDLLYGTLPRPWSAQVLAHIEAKLNTFNTRSIHDDSFRGMKYLALGKLLGGYAELSSAAVDQLKLIRTLSPDDDARTWSQALLAADPEKEIRALTIRQSTSWMSERLSEAENQLRAGRLLYPQLAVWSATPPAIRCETELSGGKEKPYGRFLIVL